jgi:hypothetical protein
MSQEKPKATLLKAILGRQVMDMVFAEHGSHHRPVQMAGVVDNKQRRVVQPALTLGRFHIIHLRS